METKPPETLEMPDQESFSGKKIDTSSAFGNPSGLARDAKRQMKESGLPAEGDGSGSAPDETLQQILKGEVPKSR